MPEEVRTQLRIVPVETMDQVLAEALIDSPRSAERIRSERAERQKNVVRRARRSRKRRDEVPVAATPERPGEQPPAGAA